MKFDVTINTDDNYIQHCMAMLCSLYENNQKHNIVLHVLKKELSEENVKLITDLTHRYENSVIFYSVDESKLVGVQFRKNRPLSMAAYYRLLLSSTIKTDIDKVLYLDCDIIILRDISEIFQIEINKYALAATLDQFPYTQQHRLQLHFPCDVRTFCSGVMLINLKYWRVNNVEEGLLEYAKRHREVVYLHDQDVLNYYFKDDWFWLPPKWNRIAMNLSCPDIREYKRFDRIEYIKKPMLIHYASFNLKPWYNLNYPDRHYYVEYLKKSGFINPRFTNVSYVKKIRMKLSSLYYPIKYFLILFRVNH